MACPYFVPTDARSSQTGPQTAILPLGDAWIGVCHANPATPCQTGDGDSWQLCHFGYARGRCRHFPEGDQGADAVRFAITRDNGASLALDCVLERDHHPFARNAFEYSLANGHVLPTTLGEAVSRQAEAYAQSYLRRRKDRGTT